MSTLTVTTLNDTVDGADGELSLREALASASSGDTIVFDAALDGGAITLNGSEFSILQDITIDATALTNGLTLDAATQSRVFNINVNDGVDGNDVSLTNLTVRNGRATGADDGGGILISGDGTAVTITDSSFLSNGSADHGGAIFLEGSNNSLHVDRGFFQFNSAQDDGGAIGNISNTSTVTVEATSFDLNQGTTMFSNGGAIWSVGDLNVASSYFGENSARGEGGAIWAIDDTVVVNSTFFSNSAISDGNAIYILNGDFDLNTSTFHSNGGDTGDSDSTILISGLGNTINNSVFLVNDGADIVPSVFDITSLTGGFNYFHTASTAFDLNSGSANIVGSPNGVLSGLGNYGGPTQTFIPLPGSPLIDAGAGAFRHADVTDLDNDGDTTELTPLDAHGNLRVSGTGLDIGAVELNRVEVSALPTTGTEAAGTALVFTVTAGAAVTSDQTVTLTLSGADVTASDFVENTLTATVTIASGQSTGTASFTIADDGVNELAETITGTISSPSSGLTLGATITATATIAESIPPAAPVITQFADDTGTSNTDGLTRDQGLIFTGTAEANASVQLSEGGTIIGTTTADGSGDWSFDYTGTTLASGNYSFTAVAVDAAGNSSPASAAVDVTVDADPPAAPVIASIADDTGASNTDRITQDTTPTITGTAEANTSVEIFRDGVSAATVTADAGGNWSLTSTTLADGTYQFSAAATDTAGNTGTSSGNVEVIVDTAIPVFDEPGSTPRDDAIDVAVNADITLGFSENIVGITGEAITVFDVTNSGAREVFTFTGDTAGTGNDGGTVSITNNQLVINPGNDLELSTDYAVQITADALDDLAGNSLQAISDTTTFSFTTAAALPPPPVPPTAPVNNGPAPATTGPDSISGGDGVETLTGGFGNDLIQAGAGEDMVYGNQDDDQIYGNQGDDLLFAGQGDDTLFGGQGFDVVYGNKGDDNLSGNKSDDALFGNQGADALAGGEGNDSLFGGQDGDTLNGGLGDDILIGGLGADVFAFTDLNGGQDTIRDYNAAAGDVIAGGLFGPNSTVEFIDLANPDAGIRLSTGEVSLTLIGVTSIDNVVFTA